MRRGKVRVFVSSRVRQSMLAEAASGTILGLSECLSADAHKVTAEALTRMEVSFVNRRRLLIYLREHPKVCMQIVRSLSEDLQALYRAFRLARSRPERRKNELDDGQYGAKEK